MIQNLWDFINELSKEYSVYRKAIMNKFKMTAAEVDVIMFLANNKQYDTAADIVRIKRIPKSHVSLAVKGLIEKGFLSGMKDTSDRKKVCLKINSAADEIVAFGQAQQKMFVKSLFDGFTDREIDTYFSFCNRINQNVSKKTKERG